MEHSLILMCFVALLSTNYIPIDVGIVSD